MKKLLFFSFFVLAATVAWAAIPISVSGYVYDVNGQGVADVDVQIFTDSLPNVPGGGYFNVVQTDATGFYQDDFEVDDTQTQGNVYAQIFCAGSVVIGTDAWFPGNTDLNIDLDYCITNTGCSVSIQQDSSNANNLPLLTGVPTGTGPFTYLWNTGENSASIQPTQAGTYCVTIADASGCTATSCVDVGNNTFCSVEIQSTPATGLVAYPTGTGPFTYLWDNGDTTQWLIPLQTGTYCVTVTDASGCTATDCYFWSDGTGGDSCSVEIELVQGGSWVQANPTGEAPFSYLWNTGETTSSIALDPNLIPCVTVTDAAGCSAVDCYYPDSTACSVIVIVNQTTNTNEYELTAQAGGTAPFTYQWDTGETTETITVDEAGVYCVVVTDANGCVATSCGSVQNADPLFQIAGTVHLADSSNFNLLSGTVYLIEYDPVDETLTAVETTELNANPNGYNSYDFGDVPTGDYLVKVALDPASPGYADHMPTYYGDVLFWDEATDIVVPYFGSASYNITLLPGNNPGGPGFIGGNVNDGANFTDGPADKSGGMENVSVLLLDPEDQGIMHTLTDANGDFAFPGLAWGTYQVIVEIPGMEHAIRWVTIGPDNPEVTTIQFVVTDKGVTTSVQSLEQQADLALYPNPATDQLFLNLNGSYEGEALIRLYDAGGQMLQQRAVQLHEGNNRTELNLRSLPAGMYFLQLTDGQSVISRTFSKQ